MNYIDFMKNGGIHIKEKNKGKFTESAKRAGESVQEHATHVLNDPNATRLQKRRAQFAKNAKKWKHEEGGILFEQTGGKALAAGINILKNDPKEEEKEEKTEEKDEKEDTTTSTSTSTTNTSDDPYAWTKQKAEGYIGMLTGTSVIPTSIAASSYSPGDPSEKRGFRNNNWLNIRKSDNAWQGKIQNGSDVAFEQFETPELGIRAAAKNIKTYASRGKNTVRDIISTWAPATENDTNSYITNVSSRMGVNPDQVIDVNDQNTMVKLLSAMTISENGREGDIGVIQRGVAMA